MLKRIWSEVGNDDPYDITPIVGASVGVDELELTRSVLRESFYEFIKEMWDVIIPEEPVWNWHIETLASEMQELAERVFLNQHKDHDTVINIPPGTTKSTVCSVMFPPWTWTRMPSACHICGSYSFPLAMDLSKKSRDIVTSEKYMTLFPEIALRIDQSAKHYFQNTKGGFRYSVGTRGSATGYHAHFIIIDDPLDPTQAASELDLAGANHWMREVLPTRKKDKRVTPTILIMQRLHQDDPSAMLLKRKNVRHICLPAEATEDVTPPNLKEHYVDRLMDPIRMPKEVLLDAEAELGQYAYSGQYLQNPVPPGGGMFKVKRLKFGRVPRKWKKLVRYWDKAGTAGGGAYTVGTLMGLDEQGRIWVLDVIRVQLDSSEREELIVTTANEDGYNCRIGLEEEPGSGGKHSADTTVRNLLGFRVDVMKVGKAEGDKVNRADPFSVQMNRGNVYLPDYMWSGNPTTGEWIEWAREWTEEFKHFPNSRYKDQVDSGSGAFSMIWKNRPRVGGMKNRQTRKRMQHRKIPVITSRGIHNTNPRKG